MNASAAERSTTLLGISVNSGGYRELIAETTFDQGIVSREDTSSEDIYKAMDYSADSENLRAILKHLKISLAFTSYQANRSILVRNDEEGFDINLKTFPRPLELTVTEQIKQPLSRRIKEDVTAPTAGNAENPLSWEQTEVLRNEYHKTLQNGDDEDSPDFHSQNHDNNHPAPLLTSRR